MKKLYRKGTVCPSPPIISDHLSFLPATILTLTAALSPEDREVLAYLISSSNNNFNFSSVNDSHGHRKTTTHNQKTVSFAKTRTTSGSCSSNDHPPLFNCDCFRCYMSYWVRWDNSPHRQLIDEIIEAFEDDQMLRSSSNNNKKTKNNNKKDKKKKGGGGSGGNDSSGELKRSSTPDHRRRRRHQLSHESTESDSAQNTSNSGSDDGGVGGGDVEEDDRGPVRSFVSFIGEKIWGVWV